MGFIQSLDEFLQHTGQVHQVSRTGRGGTTITTMSTFSCFAYFGELERVVEGEFQSTRPFGWSVLFPAEARDAIVVGALVTEITDSDNYSVITTATIKQVNPYRHWDEGLDFIVAEVEAN